MLAAAAVAAALLLLARRSPVGALLCVAALGWALGTGRLQPPAEVRAPLASLRSTVTGAQEELKARIACNVATRRAFAAGPDELEAAVTAAEAACPSAGDPLPGD
ncbi:MAG TPA: hypothetical protein VN213_21175 [Solirubrobacteraceae bacterium]|nr:hypothetical protein [Solirubrobacteraceae bacterium]